MTKTRNITFAVAVNSMRLFQNNFMASPCLRSPRHYQVLAQKEFCSAAKAYNDAIVKSDNDLIVFTHQDIIFPESWLSQCERSLDCLELLDPGWGVLGSFGMSPDGEGIGHVYSSGRGVFGGPFEQPKQVQTLDEIVLIVRRSSGLRFDERLPYFHLYGADICLRAAQLKMKNYAISAFCIHNTQQQLVLPEEFYECYKHIRCMWKDHMPIHTTCVAITKYNIPLYTRRLMEVLTRMRRKQIGALRVSDPHTLLSEFSIPPREFSEGLGLSWLTKVRSRLLGKRAHRVTSN